MDMEIKFLKQIENGKRRLIYLIIARSDLKSGLSHSADHCDIYET